MAWVYALGLLVLGFAMMLVEILVIPGVNVFGVLGCVSVCVGVLYAWSQLGLWPAVGLAGLAAAGAVLALRVMARTESLHRLVLDADVSRQHGHSAAAPAQDELVGQQGQALSALRPAGRARFGTQVLDVQSDGGFIDSGESVQVVRVTGSRVVVQRTAEMAAQSQTT